MQSNTNYQSTPSYNQYSYSQMQQPMNNGYQQQQQQYQEQQCNQMHNNNPTNIRITNPKIVIKAVVQRSYFDETTEIIQPSCQSVLFKLSEQDKKDNAKELLQAFEMIKNNKIDQIYKCLICLTQFLLFQFIQTKAEGQLVYQGSTRNRNNGQLSKGSTARQSTRPNYKFKKLQIEDEKVSPRSKDKVDVSVITEKQRHMENENESSFPSLVFPLLIFQRISYRKLLKEIKFEKGIKSLHPEDNRNIVLYRIMCELFSELNFEIQNILICQHPITKIFFMYFSDTEICPTSKCCNNNIVVKIGQVIGGQIMCLSPKCPVSILTTFEIEEKVLWQTRQQHSTVSNYVTSGKYRTKSLLQSIPSLDGNKSTNNKKSQCYNTTKQWKRSTTFHNKGSLTNCEQLYKYELSKDILMNSQVFNKDFDIQIDEKLRSKYNFQF